MIPCLICGEIGAAASLALCARCLRAYKEKERILRLHRPSRRACGLPETPPRAVSKGGELPVVCTLCANACAMRPGGVGYCGLRRNEGGRLVERAGPGSALLHFYLDRLPTNCCAAWFCRGTREDGYNLAVFFYGCNFDCLFCQNASHKSLGSAEIVSVERLVEEALRPRVRCVCFFGGSPEPQLPFALEVAERVVEGSGGRTHICWEWNGCGDTKLAEKAAVLSARSGGTVKFDLKAVHPHIASALCGVETARSFENFRAVAAKVPAKDTLTATTLLVTGYVDAEEVRGIASFIASVDAAVPYSLLVFHPDYLLDDLPVTPKPQVEECFRAAKGYLERVEIGNRGLLQGGIGG